MYAFAYAYHSVPQIYRILRRGFLPAERGFWFILHAAPRMFELIGDAISLLLPKSLKNKSTKPDKTDQRKKGWINLFLITHET